MEPVDIALTLHTIPTHCPGGLVRYAFSVIAIAFVSTVAAQQPTRAPRTIVGVVRDTAGHPVDSADITIASKQRRTKSAGDGSFRISDLESGRYNVAVRKIGYIAETQPVLVGDSGAVIEFALIPLPRRLPPVVTSVSRGGLSGIVTDTMLRPLTNVDVRVYAAAMSVRTDSNGFFFADVKPGPYMIRISRRGYGSQVLSVRVPPDSGRRIAAFLSPASTGENNREVQMLIDMSHRIAVRNVVWSNVLTREDIMKMNIPDATMLVAASAGRRVEPDCPIRINGDSSRQVGLWEIEPGDIEFMETYTPRPVRMENRSIMNGGRVRRPAEPRCVPVFIWLRK